MKQQMKFCVVSAVFASAVCAAHGVEMSGGDVPTINSTEDVTLTTSTAPCDDLPGGIATPIFWLDASATNSDWTIAANGQVSKVPSKVGDRYLTSDLTEGHFKGWPSSSNPGWYYVTLYKPYLVTNETELTKGVSLDFGIRNGSGDSKRRALIFNPVSVPEGAAVSNLLVNIGTVIMVVKPNTSASYFPLGGGYGQGSGDEWLRDCDYTEGAKGSDEHLTAPLLRSGTPTSAYRAILRHDGQPTAISASGWMGGWEVMSFMPTNANLRATGLGIGRELAYGYQYAGGFRVAEMLIFGTLLAKADVEKVEAYLQKKWFGKAPAAFGGNAQVGWLHTSYKEGTVRTITANVSAGDTLTVDRLQGGRLDGGFVKNGAGTLALKDASRFGGPVTLNGGTLEFPAKTVPTLADLPDDAYGHFDASDLSTLTYDAETLKVSAWSNTTERTLYGKAFGLCQNTASAQPTLRKDALGAGLNILDFGSLGNSGCKLAFTTSGSSKASVVDRLTTVVGVMGAHTSGGHLFGNAGSSDSTRFGWNRQGSWISYTASLLRDTVLNSLTTEPLYATNALIVIDNVKASENAGYPHPGYQVTAIRMPGACVRDLCSSSDGSGHVGGMRVGELFIFRRVLSETEMRDISAYLAKKWFGVTAPGYRAPASAVPQLASVTVAEASSISVPADTTVRLGTLAGTAAITKTGAGTLAVEQFDTTGAITVGEGALEFVAKSDPGANLCQVAAGASLHLDATDTSRMELSGDTEMVTRWYSQIGTGYCWSDTRYPTLTRDAFGAGLHAVDFTTGSSQLLAFDTSRDAVRSVFAIWRTTNKDALLLGSCTKVTEAVAGKPYDFIRNEGTGYFLNGKEFQWQNVDSVYTNGVKTTYKYIPTDQPCHLVELHLKKGFHASGLNVDRANTGNGGLQLGEIVVYERALTERERVATRNYLMKKWFAKTDDELTPLPAVETVTNRIGAVSVAAGATATLGGNVSIAGLEVRADATSPAVTVDGAFEIAEGQVITLTNAEGLPALDDFALPILSATSFTGADRTNLRTAVINGIPAGRRAKLAVEDGVLVLRFSRKGLVLTVY